MSGISGPTCRCGEVAANSHRGSHRGFRSCALNKRLWRSTRSLPGSATDHATFASACVEEAPCPVDISSTMGTSTSRSGMPYQSGNRTLWPTNTLCGSIKTL